MIIDTSVMIAILLNEPDALAYVEAINAAPEPMMSAVSFFEAGMVMQSRHKDAGVVELEAFIREAEITVVPFDGHQADTALRAFRKYGRGRHPAKLNFGDCMAYALASEMNEALLFKGTDFAATDITPALKA